MLFSLYLIPATLGLGLWWHCLAWYVFKFIICIKANLFISWASRRVPTSHRWFGTKLQTLIPLSVPSLFFAQFQFSFSASSLQTTPFLFAMVSLSLQVNPGFLINWLNHFCRTVAERQLGNCERHDSLYCHPTSARRRYCHSNFGTRSSILAIV